jgi:hypothetical protein
MGETASKEVPVSRGFPLFLAGCLIGLLTLTAVSRGGALLEWVSLTPVNVQPAQMCATPAGDVEFSYTMNVPRDYWIILGWVALLAGSVVALSSPRVAKRFYDVSFVLLAASLAIRGASWQDAFLQDSAGWGTSGSGSGLPCNPSSADILVGIDRTLYLYTMMAIIAVSLLGLYVVYLDETDLPGSGQNTKDKVWFRRLWSSAIWILGIIPLLTVNLYLFGAFDGDFGVLGLLAPDLMLLVVASHFSLFAHKRIRRVGREAIGAGLALALSKLASIEVVYRSSLEPHDAGAPFDIDLSSSLTAVQRELLFDLMFFFSLCVVLFVWVLLASMLKSRVHRPNQLRGNLRSGVLTGSLE